MVPLLESSHALATAGEPLGAILDDPAHRAHVARRGDSRRSSSAIHSARRRDRRQPGGILEAQSPPPGPATPGGCAGLFPWLRGLGEPGGRAHPPGPPRPAPGRFSGDLKVTEQGETRAFHFGDPGLASRYLERTVGAGPVVRFEARTGAGTGPTAGEPDLPALADASRACFAAWPRPRAPSVVPGGDAAGRDRRPQHRSCPAGRGAPGAGQPAPSPGSSPEPDAALAPAWFGAGAGLQPSLPATRPRGPHRPRRRASSFRT